MHVKPLMDERMTENQLPGIGNCERRKTGVVRTEIQASRKVTVSKPNGVGDQMQGSWTTSNESDTFK
jgi:hypothetical protein